MLLDLRCPGRLASAVLLGCVLCLGVMGCTRRSDEERLRAAIDVLPVHLYVALKVALLEPERDADVKATRARLDEVRTIMVLRTSTNAGAEHVGVGDALALGRALWALRGIGQQEVAAGRESTLPPLLAGAEAQLGEIDRGTDHALLLLGLLLAKIHPQSPTPVPQALLLYEAWMTGSDPLSLAALEPTARSAQAYVYASSDLCDLAMAHTAELAQHALGEAEREALWRSLEGFGRLASHAPGAGLTAALAGTLPWWSRILAHVTTARCLDARKQPLEATREWERAVDVAGRAGFPETELSFLRAYLAHRGGDAASLRTHLTSARASSLLDATARGEIDALIEHYAASDSPAPSSLFDSVSLAGFVAKMGYQRMQQVGLFEALAATPAFERARSVVGVLDAGTEPAADAWSRVRAWMGAAWTAAAGE
jgi:hypothetical protein